MTTPGFDAVVAADEDDGIGQGDGLPWPRLPSDLAHFKRVTSAAPAGRQNAIVMGRTTWDTLRGRALPGRINIVLSRRPGYAASGAIVATSLDAGMAAAAKAGAAATFVVGGAHVFREAFAHSGCRSVYLTRVLGRFPADTRLPEMAGFLRAAVLAEGADGEVGWRIERWTRGGAPVAGDGAVQHAVGARGVVSH